MIIVVDTSEIRHGKLERVKEIVDELVDFVESNEPDPTAYSIYFDDAGARMTVVQIHPTSASMEVHMEVAGPIFRKFAGLLELQRVDFFGQPSDTLLERMRQKAAMLGAAPVVVNELHAGFARFGVQDRV